MNQTMTDLQNTIGDWAAQTFQRADPLVTLAKLRHEVDELEQALRNGTAIERDEEACDVGICLMVLASEIGCDLEFGMKVKHMINSNRAWSKNPDGTYSHVTAAAGTSDATEAEQG